MKFWTKTYFFVLILFLVFFNGSICWIMYTTHQYMLESEKGKSQEQYHFIRQALENDIDSLNDNNKLSDKAIKNLIDYYSNYYDRKNISLLLEKDKEVLFSNLQYKLNTSDSRRLLNLKGGQNIVVLEQNKDKYILISGVIDNLKNKYCLVYCYKLDRITSVWNKLETVFVYFSLFISVLLALLLGILLNSRSKPLKKLIGIVDQIKDGNYGSKIKIKGKDEFAMLGTNFNEMSDKIGATVKQLNKDMEMKQQFIDNLSHELRTPLTSIYGYAEYIQKAVISEEDKYEATKYIMEESMRLQHMANRLLDMTIRRKSEIVKNEINVDELLDKVLMTVRPITNERFITINIRNNLSKINGEMQLIESLLVNLLDNAIKASEKNEPIEIVTFSSDDKSIIQIIDNGKGISDEHINHIMEPFYRADKARSKSEGGVGLGLSLCKQIMDMHNGCLEISSKINKGTTITMIFTTS